MPRKNSEATLPTSKPSREASKQKNLSRKSSILTPSRILSRLMTHQAKSKEKMLLLRLLRWVPNLSQSSSPKNNNQKRWRSPRSSSKSNSWKPSSKSLDKINPRARKERARKKRRRTNLRKPRLNSLKSKARRSRSRRKLRTLLSIGTDQVI